MKPSEFYQQQSSSSGSTNAETSSVLVSATPSPVVSNSLVTTGLVPSHIADLFSSPEDDTLNKPKY